MQYLGLVSCNECVKRAGGSFQRVMQLYAVNSVGLGTVLLQILMGPRLDMRLFWKKLACLPSLPSWYLMLVFHCPVFLFSRFTECKSNALACFDMDVNVIVPGSSLIGR